ncbi:MAG: hypothetical protein P1U42_02835 [Phycisphaerales bacterium]|nr:hypothetical protein [Phycisphaerales bacterium]
MMQTDTIELNLAHSPDSDDLVMWWPLIGVHNPDGTPIVGPLGQPQVDTGRFQFNLIARDVEELNKIVVGSDDSNTRQYDITAISCAAYPAIADRYVMTKSGGSFGENYGPRLVVAQDSPIKSINDLQNSEYTVAIPGINTSAFMCLRLAVGDIHYSELLFSEIPKSVASGKFDAGLLIHEAQLTYSEMGLREIGDMGKWWFSQTAQPLPLGLNVISRSLDTRYGSGTCEELAAVLNASVRCCVEMGDASRMYLQLNKGDRTEWDDPELVDRYLAMYVSGLTLDMGETGQAAIQAFLGQAAKEGFCDRVENIAAL